MTTENNLQTARRFVAAFDAKSWSDYANLATPNVVYEEKSTQRRTEGTGQMVELFQGWARAFPDARGQVTSCFGSGDLVALEVTWTGVHSGALAAPGATIAASGKSISVPAAYVLAFQAGKVREARHYFDLADLLRQIGAPAKR